MIQVIDDVISKEYQNELEYNFLGVNIPWTFSGNLVDEDSGEIGFGYNLIMPNYESKFYKNVLPLISEISKKSGIEVNSVFAGRTFLQVPSVSNSYNDLFHVDVTVNHTVFLYYINDSDGDTIISDEKFIESKNQFKSREYQPKILKKIQPKKGRAVIFNGLFYHAAGVPKKNIRCVLNFDINC